MEKISFIASLPPIQSAVSVSGNGDGARVKLDVPGSEMSEVLKLLLLTGKTFRVTVEAVE
ncbi:hypothetical protein ciss_07270 [Carboxydothermus islandicus]|uniref:Uncharacterized protein n=1 Tax=Carboxydothermus islandicus TaxID=661089 RepID=A0A1L8D0X6_9THEO|nr:hypothetical protein [Carboxydothermus islandicus]GAV24794.1 hypothetical protein ciss_07270 [Carboxydothermus islandicus]